MPNYALPEDTNRNVARDIDISNLALLIGKYVAVNGSGEILKEKDSGQLKAASNFQFDPAMLTALDKRQRAMLRQLQPGVVAYEAGPQARCIVGLGNKGAREVGIRLHHLYGCPIIPGSALKGLARARALTNLWLKLEKKGVRVPTRKNARGQYEELGALSRLERDVVEYNADLKAKDRSNYDYLYQFYTNNGLVEMFRHLFGTQDNTGQAIFYDALPLSLTLELDIMNPHYPDYYNNKGQGNHPPADYDSPTPVNFLTVGKASRFLFGVAARNGDAAVAKQAWDFLQRGLEQMGIGAKTTSGYGVFTNFQQVQP